jgi:hypothetical protein
MTSRLTTMQRELLDQICSDIANCNLHPALINQAFADFEATINDPLTREIAARFKDLLRDMPLAGEIREELLALLGSWGDTLDDDDVLEILKHGGRVFSAVFARARPESDD